jgi:hypothetical protein
MDLGCRDMETEALAQDIFHNAPSGPQTTFEHMEQTIRDESAFVAKEVSHSSSTPASALPLIG